MKIYVLTASMATARALAQLFKLAQGRGEPARIWVGDGAVDAVRAKTMEFRDHEIADLRDAAVFLSTYDRMSTLPVDLGEVDYIMCLDVEAVVQSPGDSLLFGPIIERAKSRATLRRE